MRDHEQLLIKLQEGTKIVNECFIYTIGSFSNGYRYMNYDGLVYGVHRWAAYIFYNLNLDNTNQYACHKCHRKDCWNPEHLYVGDAFDNMRDWRNSTNYRNYNAEKTHCNRGHELNETNLRLEGKSRRCKACHKIAVKNSRLRGKK